MPIDKEIEVRVISAQADFLELKEQWDLLLQKHKDGSVFLTWEWMHTWWGYYCQSDPACRLHILTAWKNGNLIAILPTFIRTTRLAGILPVKVLKFLGSEYESPDFLNLITTAERQPSVTKLFLQHLTSQQDGPDYLELRDMLEDATVSSLLDDSNAKGLLARKHLANECPLLTVPENFEDYVSSLSKNFRYQFRRYSRRILEKEGGEFLEVTSEKELPNMVERLFFLHGERWQKKAGNSGFVNEKRLGFHKEVSKVLYKSTLLRFFYIEVESEVIACLYCFQYGDVVCYYQGGFAPEWARKSAGVVIMGKAIEQCSVDKKRLYHFLRGKEAHKLKWTSDVVNTAHVTLGISAIGKLYFYRRQIHFAVQIQLEHLKARLKRSKWFYDTYRRVRAGK